MNHFGLMIDWGLSPTEANVLFCLHANGAGGTISKQTVQHVAGRGTQKTEGLGRVLICRLRQKLTGYGVVIKSIRGQGYELTEASLEAIDRKLTAAPYRVHFSNDVQQQGV